MVKIHSVDLISNTSLAKGEFMATKVENNVIIPRSYPNQTHDNQIVNRLLLQIVQTQLHHQTRLNTSENLTGRSKFTAYLTAS